MATANSVEDSTSRFAFALLTADIITECKKKFTEYALYNGIPSFTSAYLPSVSSTMDGNDFVFENVRLLLQQFILCNYVYCTTAGCFS
jgi:hypothetical protein